MIRYDNTKKQDIAGMALNTCQVTPGMVYKSQDMPGHSWHGLYSPGNSCHGHLQRSQGPVTALTSVGNGTASWVRRLQFGRKGSCHSTDLST